MNFFEHQDKARTNTTRLLALFALAMVVLVLSLYFLVWVLLAAGSKPEDPNVVHVYPPLWDPGLLALVTMAVAFVVGTGSLYKTAQMSGGGVAVARALGGIPVSGNTGDADERRLLNVVEEMAIASGLPVPPVFVIEEPGINAFAAGWSPDAAVVGVTRGCIQLLSRDELQGVIAHEFSHVFNGDMRLNLRLIGVLHGILVIGATGYWILRMTGRVRGKNAGQLQIGMLVAGLGLLVIGYSGLFVARLIKSAVSREREYLADASAVQFTRNPDGIAGALKKIGGLQAGSKVTHQGAEQVSHLFFSDAVRNLSFRSGLGSLSRTHPPLVDRVKRIDRQFDGRFPRVEPPRPKPPAEGSRSARARAGSPFPGMPIPGVQIPGMPPIAAAAAFSGLAGAGGGTSVAATNQKANEVVQQVGAPGAEHLDYSRALLMALPDHVREAARTEVGAMAVVHVLLLEADRASRDAHVALIERDPAVHEEVQRLLPALTGLLPAVQLPLVDLCVPALRGLDAARRRKFLSLADELIETDHEVSPFESALRMLLHKRLEPATARNTVPRYHSIAALAQEFVLVLSLVAWSGHDSPADSMHAYEIALGRLPPHRLRPSPLPRADCTGRALDAAVAKLYEATPAIKQRLIDACAHAVLADANVTVKESELLRAVSNALGCPMPPLVARPGPAGPARAEG